MTAPRRRPLSALRDFLHSEASGGIVLMIAAALALVIANGPFASSYFAALQTKVGPLSVLHWINDALMAAFFFLVGLEIKREFVDGHLATWADRRLPIIAASAGMLVPAAVFIGVVGVSSPLARGWAIPAATDIAFAIGILTLLGKRVPASLKLFLTTVAIVDDMGAVAIIALAYTVTIDVPALIVAGGTLLAMVALNRSGVRRIWPYLGLAIVLWVAVLLSGVHATIAGVLAALTIPISRSNGTPDDPRRSQSPLHRLEHAIHPGVAFAVVPLFGFANAGVALNGLGWAEVFGPLPIAIAAGLVIGKQVGVYVSVRAAVALGLGNRPRRATWLQIYGVAMLCGVGFTMSFFIGGLAFPDPMLTAEVKIGVLGGSTLSAVLGFLILRFAPPLAQTPPQT